MTTGDKLIKHGLEEEEKNKNLFNKKFELKQVTECAKNDWQKITDLLFLSATIILFF